MKNKSISMVKIFILLLPVLSSFQNIIAEENSPELPEVSASYNRRFENVDDSGYKLWYGSWEAEKKVGENYQSKAQDISDVIGKTYTFFGQQAYVYYNKKEIYIDYPKYKTTIIPLDENTTYISNMQPTLSELGIKGKYIVIFSVPEYDICFFVKDDETLIMYYKDSYIELRRTAYEKGHEVWEKAI